MEIGLSKWHHSSPLTSDEFEFAVCVCVEPDRQSFALHHTVILAIAEDKEKRKERGEIWKSAQTGAIASLAN